MPGCPLAFPPACSLEVMLIPSIHSSKLMETLRSQARIVAGWLVVCLFIQTALPGVLVTATNCSSVVDSAVDSCRFIQSGSGCCCGPSASDGCNCCCSRKPSSRTTSETTSNQRSSRKTRSVGPTFCGCRGKSQLGLTVVSEPAMLMSTDGFFVHPACSGVVSLEHSYSFARLAPPTPPPEFSI